MVFIVEVILTILAWRNGWKGWAFLPVGSMMLLGCFIGASGRTFDDFFVLIILGELVCISVLVAMVKWAPNSVRSQKDS